MIIIAAECRDDLGGHEEFLKLHERLSVAIDRVADQRDDETIAKEAKAKRLRYYSLVFLRDAKYLSREISKDKPPVRFLDEESNANVQS